MANGGIIGPVQTVQAAQCISEKIRYMPQFIRNFNSYKQQLLELYYLVLAGGGSGGYNPVEFQIRFRRRWCRWLFRTGTSSVVNGGAGYTVTVGAGGTSSTSASASAGSDSVWWRF